MHIFYLGLILFSLVGMVYVLASKIFEMQTGKTGVLTRASATLDPRIFHNIQSAKLFFSKLNFGNLQKFFGVASGYLFHAFGTVGLFVAKYYGNFTRRIKGKKILKGGGVVSFFLKDVAESKEDRKDNQE